MQISLPKNSVNFIPLKRSRKKESFLLFSIQNSLSEISVK